MLLISLHARRIQVYFRYRGNRWLLVLMQYSPIDHGRHHDLEDQKGPENLGPEAQSSAGQSDLA